MFALFWSWVVDRFRVLFYACFAYTGNGVMYLVVLCLIVFVRLLG